jgi:thymidine phosphorylase
VSSTPASDSQRLANTLHRSYLPQEIIRRKRDGGTLSADEIQCIVDGITSGGIADSQIAALAMAVFLRGMVPQETSALTKAMTASGRTLQWKGIPGPILDKHSTGGVGDVVSLILAPAVAACGGKVPMISGRGLGHTGGTLDKLESIPGYQTQPSFELFRKTVSEVGCAIIGQTAELAPADRRLYAIRDVTATVESIPLITASILSKKLAEGIDALVMNVTWGNGAFMNTLDEARTLARSLVDVAGFAGVPTTALLTDMNEPLASVAGNSLEVKYALDFLTGASREPRMREIVIALGAELLVLGNIAVNDREARLWIDAAIETGEVLERFERMVAALGGPCDLSSTGSGHFSKSPIQRAVYAEHPGFIGQINTRLVGLTVVGLGGGRTREDQTIDHAVGLSELAGIGDHVDADRPLAVVHARTEGGYDEAAASLLSAFHVQDEPISRPALITERIGA